MANITSSEFSSWLRSETTKEYFKFLTDYGCEFFYSIKELKLDSPHYERHLVTLLAKINVIDDLLDTDFLKEKLVGMNEVKK